MKQRSRKAKGRRLQNHVAKRLLKTFPHLKKKDVATVENYAPGPDIILSKVGKKLVPYQFECKNQQKLLTLYKFFRQAQKHGKLDPVLIIKLNSRFNCTKKFHHYY